MACKSCKPRTTAEHGLSWCSLPQQAMTVPADGHAPKRRKLAAKASKMVVLDIEGTLAPLTLTKDLLFPYARAHLDQHLRTTYHSRETQADIQQLLAEVGAPR